MQSNTTSDLKLIQCLLYVPVLLSLVTQDRSISINVSVKRGSIDIFN